MSVVKVGPGLPREDRLLQRSCAFDRRPQRVAGV